MKNSQEARAILVADTDATQSYVFESDKLPEIRGASALLDKLNREIGEWTDQVIGGECVYAGGGSLVALLPLDKAQRLAERIEKHYPKESGLATITADYRPIPKEHSFGELMGWAGYWLRRRKESKGAPPFYETLPFQVRCSSTHNRPALAETFALPDGAISRMAQIKRDWGKKGGQVARFDLVIRQDLELLQAYYGKEPVESPKIPLTIDEIGRAGEKRNNFVGFLYLDGDGIGKLLEKIKSQEAYRQLSRALEESTEQAVYGALAQHLTPKKVEGSDLRDETGKVFIHPFEIVALGGDDVMLIVPADKAIPIACQIGTVFSQQMTKAGYADVSMSAGVLIAEVHTPIRVMRDLAEQLLKKGAKLLPSGGIDFHILKSVDMLDDRIDKVREAEPYHLNYGGKDGSALRLLGRPYSYEKMMAVWDGLKRLKEVDFSTSQMNALASSLLDGRAQSTLFYQYQKSRNRGSGYESLEKLLHEVQKHTAEDPTPWEMFKEEDFSHKTALWDLAELYEFA